MNTGIGSDYDFNSEENASKWKGLLTAALKRVSTLLLLSYRQCQQFFFCKLSRGALIFLASIISTLSFKILYVGTLLISQLTC